MKRYCFTLQVAPDRLEEYRERHEHVWPEMLEALRDSGWRDYHLFLRDDGLLIGFLLADDFAAAQQAMETTGVNERWQEQMAPFFVGLDDQRPDEGMRPLDEVFHLETALRDAGLPSEGDPQ